MALIIFVSDTEFSKNKNNKPNKFFNFFYQLSDVSYCHKYVVKYNGELCEHY